MATYTHAWTSDGRVVVIRLSPAWVVAARLSGEALVAPPRIDKRHWGIEAIVWEAKCRASGRYNGLMVVSARAKVLARILTDGSFREDQIPTLPKYLPINWAVESIHARGGWRALREYEPAFPVPPITL